METTPEQLAQSDRAYLVAAAGYGKTQIIAQAVRLAQDKRQLILTHTHAGVQSLVSRLQRLNVPPRNYRVSTIAGWARDYIQAFPLLSGVSYDFVPTNNDEWNNYYSSTEQLVKENNIIQKVVQASYGGVYVDEYQDCTVAQHNLISQLAELLPCRLVGDPLQSLFRFSGDAIDWQEHVSRNFNELPELQTPWRWKSVNPQLGTWLVQFRQALQQGNPIDLQGLDKWGIYWHEETGYQSILNVCSRNYGKGQSVVVIRELANKCHALAQSLVKWNYSSIEEMEAKDLIVWLEEFETNQGNLRAATVIDFCSDCMTGVSKQLGEIRKRFGENANLDSLRNHKDIISVLQAVTETDTLVPVLEAINLISKLPDTRVYRPDLLYEMQRTLRNYNNGSTYTLIETARRTRNQTSIIGRKIGKRVVSRTLLVKGLEFDHSIVLDVENFDIYNLYVGMTRGTSSVTVVSKSPIC